MGTLRGTQIHLCFCKSLIASGSGKEGWLWGGNFQASATETETEPEPRKRRDGRPRDGVTETEGQRTGRWRDGEMERWRSRARTWQATERDACSNRNVKVRGEEARLGTRSVRPGYEIRNVINVKN